MRDRPVCIVYKYMTFMRDIIGRDYYIKGGNMIPLVIYMIQYCIAPRNTKCATKYQMRQEIPVCIVSYI